MVNHIDDDDDEEEEGEGGTKDCRGSVCFSFSSSLFPSAATLSVSSPLPEETVHAVDRDVPSRQRDLVCRVAGTAVCCRRRGGGGGVSLVRCLTEEEEEGERGNTSFSSSAHATTTRSSSSSSFCTGIASQRSHPRSTAVDSSNRVKRCNRVDGGRYSSGVRGPNCCDTKEGVKEIAVESGDATAVGVVDVVVVD